MILPINDNFNSFQNKNGNILQIVENSIKEIKERFIYTQISNKASVARAVTMSVLIQKVKDLFLQKKKNSFSYSLFGNLTKENRFRFMRLSRRELISRLQQILLCNYVIDNGELYNNISYKDMAIEAETSERNIKRIFSLFQKKGWVTIIKRQRLGRDGNLYAMEAQKFVNPLFFIQAIGQGAWEKVLQYRRKWEISNEGRKKKERKEEILARRKTIRSNPLNWKAEALAPYLEKQEIAIKDPSVVQSLISGLTRSKITKPQGYASLVDSQRKIYKEDYYDSYKSEAFEQPIPSSSIPQETQPYVPQHACHKEFIAPTVSQPTEQMRSAARNAIAEMKAKLGMRKTSPP